MSIHRLPWWASGASSTLSFPVSYRVTVDPVSWSLCIMQRRRYDCGHFTEEIDPSMAELSDTPLGTELFAYRLIACLLERHTESSVPTFAVR